MINIVSRAYCSRIPSGPKKVVDNLAKGLEQLGYPFVINKRLDACQRLWIHDDIAALWEIKNLPPKIKVVVGPNLFVLPRHIPKNLDLSTTVMSFPSEWIKDFWLKFNFKACPIEVCPAGINTGEFVPNTAKKEFILLYFKQRPLYELAIVEDALRRKNLAYKVLKYGHYKEADFRKLLNKSRYIVWLGRQESQGIALEEALSCNVPILVCDVKNFGHWSAGPKEMAMFNEEENLYNKATSAPYFDSSCGLKIKDLASLDRSLDEMELQLYHFNPRLYVEKNLNLKKQAKDFLGIFEKYYGLSIVAGQSETLLKSGDWINNSPSSRIKFFLKDILKLLK